MKVITLAKVIILLALFFCVACKKDQDAIEISRIDLPQKCLLTSVYVNDILSSEYEYDGEKRIVTKKGYWEDGEMQSEFIYSYSSESEFSCLKRRFENNQAIETGSVVYKLNVDGTSKQSESDDYKEIYSYSDEWMKSERFSEGRYSGYTITYFDVDNLQSQSYRYNSSNKLSHKNENFYSENPNPYFPTLMPMYKLETLRDHF